MSNKKRGRQPRQQLITIIAEEILKGTHKTHNPETFYKVARKKIHKMKPETMGKLAAQTKAHKKDPKYSMLAIHHEENFINYMSSGREVLRILAATAIAAECIRIIEQSQKCA